MPARTERAIASGVDGLHADDADLEGGQPLDVGRHAGDQPAAADRDEHGVDVALVLAQDLHRDVPWPATDVGVVERVDEREPALSSFEGVGVGVGIAVAVEHDLAAERAHRVHL